MKRLETSWSEAHAPGLLGWSCTHSLACILLPKLSHVMCQRPMVGESYMSRFLSGDRVQYTSDPFTSESHRLGKLHRSRLAP